MLNGQMITEQSISFRAESLQKYGVEEKVRKEVLSPPQKRLLGGTSTESECDGTKTFQ